MIDHAQKNNPLWPKARLSASARCLMYASRFLGSDTVQFS